MFISLNCYARFGFAVWKEETPFGNSIQFDERCLHMRNGIQVNYLNEWYFYKDCVIGTTRFPDKILSINKYFVANEMFNTIDSFNNETDWKAFIKLHNLEPIIWKRTFASGWSVLTGLNIFLFLFIFIAFGIPVFIIYRIIRTAIKIDHINFKKPLKFIAIAIISLIVIRYLLDLFPGSI